MSAKKQAVLFDLDGTLIDTAKDFIRIIQQMCRDKGLAEIDEDLIRSQVSEGARAMVHLVYPDLTLDSAELLQLRQQFLDIYEQNICVDTTLFDGMNELLLDLEQRQIPWGIVTNKPRYLSELLLKALNLTERCSVLVCPDDVSKTKPDPEPMYLACKHINIGAKDCIYVGDHPRDIDAGRNAEMYTILAAYGYLPMSCRDDLQAWNTDEIVQNIAELKQAISALT